VSIQIGDEHSVQMPSRNSIVSRRVVWQGKLPSHIFTWLIALEEKAKPEHAICAWIPNQTVDNREFETDPARIRSYSVGPLCDLSLLGRLLTRLGSQLSCVA